MLLNLSRKKIKGKDYSSRAIFMNAIWLDQDYIDKDLLKRIIISETNVAIPSQYHQWTTRVTEDLFKLVAKIN